MQKTTIYLSAACILLSLLFVACEKNEDTTPQGVVYVSNQVSPINQFDFRITYNTFDKTTLLEGDTIYKFPIRVTMPAQEKITAKFEISEKFTSEYNEVNNTEYTFLPESYYTIVKNEATIEQGESESKDSISVLLNTKADWTKVEGGDLLIPIQLISANGNNVRISENMNTVKVFGNLFMIIDNIDSSNEPIEGEMFNDGLALRSNRDPNGLWALTDGETWGDVWYPLNQTHYIDITLEKEEIIKGILIHTSIGRYQLGSLRVATTTADHGVFTTDKETTNIYIKFKTPTKAKNIRISNFKTLSGANAPDLYEINLIK